MPTKLSQPVPMDSLGNGAVFHFHPHDPKTNSHPGFVKISNMYAVDLKDGRIGPNTSSRKESDAAEILVVYTGEVRRDLFK